MKAKIGILETISYYNQKFKIIKIKMRWEINRCR